VLDQSLHTVDACFSETHKLDFEFVVQ
jgi:hypothetical protein